MTRNNIPHLSIVIGFCIAAIAGYAVFSAWVVFYSDDDAMTGDVIGTWKSFAVGAFAFWLGSSSGGKAKDDTPTGKPGDPVAVQGAPEGSPPVTTQDAAALGGKP